MANIVIFGDSISRGAFDIKTGGWINLLKMFFWQKNF
jgi:lysophospholipase L1-like esterase